MFGQPVHLALPAAAARFQPRAEVTFTLEVHELTTDADHGPDAVGRNVTSLRLRAPARIDAQMLATAPIPVAAAEERHVSESLLHFWNVLVKWRWLIGAALQNPNFALHQLARQYGVQYVIAGHLHQMLRFDLQGLTYISMPSAGGHLRASRKYQDGWFFGQALVEVHGTDINFQIEELKPPYGQGRVTKPSDWGMLGLVVPN